MSFPPGEAPSFMENRACQPSHQGAAHIDQLIAARRAAHQITALVHGAGLASINLACIEIAPT